MARNESGTVRPAKRRRVFLAAAVVLLVCVLAAGAVSADTVTVSNYEQLSKNISNAQNDRTIIIAEDIPVGANQWFTVTKNITLTTTANADHRIYRTVAITSNQNGMFTIQNGGNLTIQGNNSKTLTLDGNQTEVSDNGQTLVWINSGGNFTLNSGGVLTNNNVTGQSTTSPGDKNSGAVYVSQGTFTMNGGEISNNIVGNSGGGVYVYKGIFTMVNGKISNNTAGKNGGGVCIYTGTFTMNGGTITNNTVTRGNGGGVYLVSDQDPQKLSVFTMTDGEISNNTAGSGNGGGVDVRPYCEFRMSGGTITGNTAKGTGQGANLGNGGGVGITGGTFTLSGGTITDNEADTNGNGVYVGDMFNVKNTGTADSVYLPEGKTINVTGKFAGTISGIESEKKAEGTTIVSFQGSVQGSSEDRKYFQLDETLTERSLGLTYDASKNVLELAPTHTVTFNADGGTPVPGDQTVAHGDTVDDPGTLTRDGHTFAGWHKDTDCTQSWNFDTDTVTYDRTLYAKWTPKEPGPEPPSGGSSGDGNMDNAYRVLFNDGATTLYVVTDLSAGDKLTKPEDPVKDGYTFAGWHKDSACTQAWDFNDGITGSMTLYAKWTPQETVTPTATATATPTVTATTTITSTPTGEASPAPTVQPDNNGNNGDTTNGETTTTPGISLPYLIGGILILLLAILLLLFLLLRHTVTFLIPTGGELEEYRIKVWHGRYINTEDLPDLIRTAAWYRDPARQERWDFDQDRVKKSIELYLG